MANLRVNLAGVSMRNPILTASGTFGYAKEYEHLVSFDNIGGVTVKGVSPFPSHGNPTPRTTEVYGGMLNAIGLQNPGIDKFIAHPDYLPYLRTLDCAVFVNIWGRTIEQYAEVASRLEDEKQGIAALEINISCPNIKEGGIAFGTDTTQAAAVVRAVRKATSLPLVTKLSPNVTKISDFAKAAVDAGSDMVSLINTIPGMAIDIERRTFKIANKTGGFSGPALKPIAIRMVYETRKAVDVPIIGMGGASCAEDVVEFMMAGANAVAIGTAIFSNPNCLAQIPQDLNNWLDKHNVKDVNDIVGVM
ncbi:MAG: dihydroorotate dehydrogenase [Lentisphaerae bacterium]|jgi:dihydroorotate dehydrogenase (NAD+) catalytic subunit|nr:dihydroorotate dehydrogenase [Lentisphaerota bacterium]